MTPETARCFGHMLAAQARVLGMVAENEQRKACGESPAYVESDFAVEAFQLDQLSVQVINQ